MVEGSIVSSVDGTSSQMATGVVNGLVDVGQPDCHPAKSCINPYTLLAGMLEP